MNSHAILHQFLRCKQASARAEAGLALLTVNSELNHIDFDLCYDADRLRERLASADADRRHGVGWIALCALGQALRRDAAAGCGALPLLAPAAGTPPHGGPRASAIREFRKAFAESPDAAAGRAADYLKLLVPDYAGGAAGSPGTAWADFLIHSLLGMNPLVGTQPSGVFRIVGMPSGPTGLGTILQIRLDSWDWLDLADADAADAGPDDLLLAPASATPVLARWDDAFATAMRDAMLAAAHDWLNAHSPGNPPGDPPWFPLGRAGTPAPRRLPHVAWSLAEVILFKPQTDGFEVLEAGPLESPEIQRILLTKGVETGVSADSFGRLGLTGPSAGAACRAAFLDFFSGIAPDDGAMVLGRLVRHADGVGTAPVDGLNTKLRIVAAAARAGLLATVDRIYIAGLRECLTTQVPRDFPKSIMLVDLEEALGYGAAGTTASRSSFGRPLSQRVERAATACRALAFGHAGVLPAPLNGSPFATLLEPRVIVHPSTRFAEPGGHSDDLAALDDCEPVDDAHDSAGFKEYLRETTAMGETRLWRNWLEMSTAAQVLLGRAGSGKTTVLLMTAAKAASAAALALRSGRPDRRPLVLPVFLAAKSLPNGPNDLGLDALLDLCWSKEIREALGDLLTVNGIWACEWLFLIDGLDEIEPGTPAVQALLALLTGSALRRTCQGVSVILACRQADWPRWQSILPAPFHMAGPPASLAPFGNREQRAYLTKRLTDVQAVDIERRLLLDPALRDICGVPLMLDFVANLAGSAHLFTLAGENRATPILRLVIDAFLAGGWRQNPPPKRASRYQPLAANRHFLQAALERLSDMAFYLQQREHSGNRRNHFEFSAWDLAFQHAASRHKDRFLKIPPLSSDEAATPAGQRPNHMISREFLRFCQWTGLVHSAPPRWYDGVKQLAVQHRALLEYLAARGLRADARCLRSLLDRGLLPVLRDQSDSGTEAISPWLFHPELELMLHFLLEMLTDKQGAALFRHLDQPPEDLFGTMTVWRVHAASLISGLVLDHATLRRLKTDLLDLLCQPGFDLLEWPKPLIPLRFLGGKIAASVVHELLRRLNCALPGHAEESRHAINGLGRLAGLLDRDLAEVVVKRLLSGRLSSGKAPDNTTLAERQVDALWRWTGHVGRKLAGQIVTTLLAVLNCPPLGAFVRRRAAFGLGRAGACLSTAQNAEIAEALIAILNTMKGEDSNMVRNRILDALGQLAGHLDTPTATKVIAELLRWLDPASRKTDGEAHLTEDECAVDPAARERDDRDADAWVRWGAADALHCWAAHPAGIHVTEVVDRLLDSMCFENEPKIFVRDRVAKSLDAWMAHLAPERADLLAEGFAKCLLPESGAAPAKRKRAVAALGRLAGRIGQADTMRCVAILLVRFDSSQESVRMVREHIADALGRWAGHLSRKQSAWVADVLLSHLVPGDSDDWSVRQRSIEALGRWAGHLEEPHSLLVIRGLLARLAVRHEPVGSVRERSAEALGWWVGFLPIETATEVVKALLSACVPTREPDGSVRSRAALALAAFATADDPLLKDQARDGLLECLGSGAESNAYVQLSLVVALRGWAEEANDPGTPGLGCLRQFFASLQNQEVLGCTAITLGLWAAHAPDADARKIANDLHHRLSAGSGTAQAGANAQAASGPYDGSLLVRRRLAEALRIIAVRRRIFVPRLGP